MTLTCTSLIIGLIQFHINSLPLDIKTKVGEVDHTFHISKDYKSEGANWVVMKKGNKTLTVDMKCE